MGGSDHRRGLVCRAALALGACGDDDGNPTDGAAGGATTSTSTASSGSGDGGAATTSTGDGGTSSVGGGGGAGGGAGGPAAIDDLFRSGERLRAIVWDAGGDARRLEGWYDAELEVECQPARQPGGTQRCIPPSAGFHGYRDAGCTEHVVLPYAIDCLTIPAYVAEYVNTSEACNANDSAHHRTYRVVGDAGVVEQMYFLTSSGECNPWMIPDRPTVLVEPVPIDTFVALHDEIEAIDDAMARRVTVADDGARFVVGPHDVARDLPCGALFPPPEDGSLVCIPPVNRRHREFSYWGDAACGEAAVPIGPCDDPTRPVVDFVPTTCGQSHSVLREPGPAFAEHLHETFGNNPACEPMESTFGIGVGQEIPIADFPPLERIDLQGDTADLRVMARSGRAVDRSGVFVVPGTGEACSEALGDDGVWRCLPQTPTVEAFTTFADDACTIPLARRGRGDLSCGEAVRVAVAVTPEACAEEELTAIHHLGDPHEGAVFTLDDGGACVEQPVDDVAYARLGEPIELDELPRLELVVE